MVITSVSRGRAYSFPVLLSAIGAGLLAMAAGNLRRIDAWDGVYAALAMVLFGAGAVWMGASGARVLAASGDRLQVRGLGRRLAFDRQAALFGVRHQGGWRSSTFIVFVTDGTLRDDVADFQSERRARAAIVRLERALLPAPAGDAGLHRPRRLAAATIKSLERGWKANADASQAVIDAYYASPAWRRAKYGVITLVVLYSIAMLIFGAWDS